MKRNNVSFYRHWSGVSNTDVIGNTPTIERKLKGADGTGESLFHCRPVEASCGSILFTIPVGYSIRFMDQETETKRIIQSKNYYSRARILVQET